MEPDSRHIIPPPKLTHLDKKSKNPVETTHFTYRPKPLCVQISGKTNIV